MSELKDENTNELKDKNTSESKHQNTSEREDPKTSEIKDQSTSESKDQSTSEIKKTDKIKSYTRYVAIIAGFLIISFSINGLARASDKYQYGFYQSQQFAAVAGSILEDAVTIASTDVAQAETESKQETETKEEDTANSQDAAKQKTPEAQPDDGAGQNKENEALGEAENPEIDMTEEAETEPADGDETEPQEWTVAPRNINLNSYEGKNRALIKTAIKNLDAALNMSIYAENITDGIVYKSSTFQPEYMDSYSDLKIVLSSDEVHNSSGLKYLENTLLEKRVYLTDKNKEYRIALVIAGQPEDFFYEDHISAAYKDYTKGVQREALMYSGIFLLGAFILAANLRQIKSRRLQGANGKISSAKENGAKLPEDVKVKKINYRNPAVEKTGIRILDEISKALKYVKLEFKALAFFVVFTQLSSIIGSNPFHPYTIRANLVSLIVGAILVYDFVKSDKDDYMTNSYFNKFVNRNKLFTKKKRSGTMNSVAKEFDKSFDMIFVIGGLIILSLLVAIMGNSWGLYIIVSGGGGLIILIQALRIRNKLIDERLAYVDEIAEKVQDIVDGKMYQVLEEKPGYPMEELAHNINLMREGYGTALQQQLKSEKMKTELITNVSHDLKTPLTSIINYVDLLKKEDILPEHARDYVTILDKKSQRLNALIQDLFEVSKAASGDLDINMEKLDIGELLYQSLAELSPQIEESSLSFITEIPKGETLALADGEKLHRVFENLITNILKYSLAGTRVYIDMQVTDKITITMKNISSYKMNFSKEDITQRFTRADEARSSEGSGLGLAISKSLLDLMKMDMNIMTDGDLFKVEIVIGRSL